MKILAIETSCDETAIAVVECSGGITNPHFKVLKNIVSSQIKSHREFGGVVPMLAKRKHNENLSLIYDKLDFSEKDIDSIDAIAVTVGPGLEPALWAGIVYAKELSKELKKPLLGVNHLEAHLYSSLLSGEKIPLPAIGLIVSGGHTILLLLKKLDERKKLGETVDDAVGEAYDKIARLIGLPYPGGPEIEKVSKDGDPKAIDFPRPMIHQKNYNFSFSGLKTAVYYYIRDSHEKSEKFTISKYKSAPKLSKKEVADIATSFQQAAIDVLSVKTMRAVKEYNAKSIILAGGVAANKALRARLKKDGKKIGAELITSEMKYSTDNAAMIATAAYINHLRGKKYRLVANGNLSL